MSDRSEKKELRLNGRMMDTQLTIPSILQRAAKVYPEKEVAGRRSDGTVARITYGGLYERIVRMMNALRGLGVRPGDRVATCCCNSVQHLELYFAVPSIGAVLHTVNIRLFPEQILYILQHAEDRLIFMDQAVTGLIGPLRPHLRGDTQLVVIGEDRSDGPDTSDSSGRRDPMEGALNYEAFIASAGATEDFPNLDEWTAAGLCYTSGTTGDPKGVLYSHRSTYLHAMGACMADSAGLGERDTVLPVVPMFHANAWGLPYACALTGANQVLPGAVAPGAAIAQLIEQERVTLAAGVPTVWRLLHQHLKQRSYDLSSLRAILCGGAAVARSLIEDYERDFGINLVHAWGMTETSPIGSVCRIRGSMSSLPADQQMKTRVKQGTPVPGVEARILSDEGVDLPHDGTRAGELLVRGPWVAAGYYREEEAGDVFTEDGWLRTGDIATIDEFGYIEITDRRKDIIKSRGEWISSVEMENLALDHSNVREAAVVGRPDAMRGEAPILFVVLESPMSREDLVREMLDLLGTRFAKWQMPKRADIRGVDSLSKTSVGKIDKKALRRISG